MMNDRGDDDWKNNSNEELEDRVSSLRRQLHQMTQELQQRRRVNDLNQNLVLEDDDEDDEDESKSNTKEGGGVVLMKKRGYLWKWQDRRISWNGTRNWDLRYVCLSTNGTLKYYKEHSDANPRYEITLLNCTVRDDGQKQMNDKKKTTYHLFSILPASCPDVPLLRFSSTTLADKTTWIQAINLAIDYCHSPNFQNKHLNKSSSSNILEASSPPKGTLPAMYFSPVKSFVSLPKAKEKKQHHPNKKGKNKYSYPPSKPMHRESAPSYLSNEAGKRQNYRGILNLGILILIISHLRLILHTIAEHGSVLTRWTTLIKNYDSSNIDNSKAFASLPPLLLGLIILNVGILLTFTLESILSTKKSFSKNLMLLHYSLAHTFGIVLPMTIIWYTIDNPFVGGFYLVHSTVIWMKLLSYIHANEDYRTQPSDHIQSGFALVSHLDEDEIPKLSYPQNVTLKNIYYFMLAPTLTYQMAYPRMMRKTIRWTRVCTLILRLFFCSVITVLLIGQVVTPQLERLIEDLNRYNEPHIFSPHIFGEYLLKLALANTYIWLLGFYSLFHLWLNLWAELLRFGDCVFYRDWWNSSEVSSYWRLWNLPVHYWLVRHLYFPCIRSGFSKTAAMFVVFFFSAVMHEVLISIPFHMIRPWAFWGMMGQVPLVMITKYFEKLFPGSSIGNITFWISFCLVGQPMAVLMYTIDYWKQQNDIMPSSTNFSSSEL